MAEIETLVGQFDRVRWSSSDEDSNFMVGLLADGTVIVGDAEPGELVSGITYKFFGYRDKHHRHGEQFRFEQFVPQQPHSRQAIVAYLKKHAGIGPASASRLYDAFGQDAVKVLRTQPAEAARAVKTLELHKAESAARALTDSQKYEDVKIELCELFAGRGFPRDTTEQAINKWGILAPARIKRDPFCLMVANIPGAGFSRCDRLYLDLGHPPDRLKRQVMCVWHALHGDMSGNTWINGSNVFAHVGEKMDGLGVGAGMQVDKAIKVGVRAKWLVERVDENGVRWVAECKKAEAEKKIADKVSQMLRVYCDGRFRQAARRKGERRIWSCNESLGNGSRSLQQDRILDARGRTILRRHKWPDIAFAQDISDHQREQAAVATSRAIGVIGGNPGVGKTRVLAAMIKLCDQPIGTTTIGDVAVCAPTGKAANRLTDVMQSYGLVGKATTIHRLLGPQRNGHDGGGWGFLYGQQNRLPFRYVFVDEASMLDTSLASALMSAMPDDANLLFCGDLAQLPPVGHGAPLRDMIAAGVPYGELTEPHRNGGDILRVCRELKEFQGYKPSKYRDLPEGENVWHAEASNPGTAMTYLSRLIQSPPPGIDPRADVQVLCAVNEKTPMSRENLNRTLQMLINGKAEIIEGLKFRLGDKVVCKSNQFLPMVICPTCRRTEFVLQEKGKYACWACSEKWPITKAPNDFVANGEVGFVVWGAAKEMHVEFESPKRTVRVAGEQLGDFSLAYALTVHSAQGSEWPVVVMMVDDTTSADWVTSMEYHRTAVSRAKQVYMTIGKLGAINRQCRESSLAGRKTFLAESIRERISA